MEICEANVCGLAGKQHAGTNQKPRMVYVSGLALERATHMGPLVLKAIFTHEYTCDIL